MSNFSIQWVKTAKNGSVELLSATSVLINRPTSNNREMPDSIVSKNDYFCVVYYKKRYCYEEVITYNSLSARFNVRICQG